MIIRPNRSYRSGTQGSTGAFTKDSYLVSERFQIPFGFADSQIKCYNRSPPDAWTLYPTIFTGQWPTTLGAEK